MNSKLQIVHFISGLGVGGAEMSLLRLIMATKSTSHHVVVLGKRGALSGPMEAEATRVLYLHGSRRQLGPSVPLGLLLLGLEPMRADCLHGWMYHGCLAASLCRAWARGARVIWGVRQSLASLEREPRLTRVVIRATQVMSRFAHRITYNSRIARTDHERLGYPQYKGSVIPNGYDTEYFRPDVASRAALRGTHGLPNDAIIVGLAARFHPMKDHRTFFAAVKLAAELRPRLHWIIAGEGCHLANPEFAALVPRELTTRLIFTGRCDDMRSFHASIDIVTSSSAWGEAFSNVIAEGMASGAVPVATNVGDSAQIIGDRGVVVPAQSPEALANAWVKLADVGREQLTRLGQRARDSICHRFGMAKVADAYLSLYSSENTCAALQDS